MARTKQTARKSVAAFAAGGATKVVPLEPAAGMTADQADLIRRENEIRELFITNPSDGRLGNPHVLLVNVFGEHDSFTYQAETPDEAAVPKLLTANRRVDMTGPSVCSQAEFRERWGSFTKDVFAGMNWNNVFIAGGAVLSCLMKDPGAGFAGSDIDIFIYGLRNDDEANQKLKEVYETIHKNSKSRGDVIRTNRAVTIIGEYPYRHTQIILKIYRSPAEVLLGFDIDACCVGFDGTDVWAAERARRALNKSYNLVNMTRRSLTYETRLKKYAKRGFAVAVPDLDKARVDPQLFHRSAQVNDQQGLAKLLLFEYLENNRAPKKLYSKTTKTAVTEFTSDAVEEYENLHQASDYAEVFLPWGPNWYSKQILRLLDSKDRAAYFSQAKSDFAHRHIFASGIDAAVQGPVGHEAWCMHCRSRVQLQPSENNAKFAPQKLEWIKETPAMQDFENGRTRKLITGSFHPVIEADWSKDVYVPEGTVPSGGGVHPLAQRSVAPAGGSAPFGSLGVKPSATGTAVTYSNFPFGGKGVGGKGVGGKNFPKKVGKVAKGKFGKAPKQPWGAPAVAQPSLFGAAQPATQYTTLPSGGGGFGAAAQASTFGGFGAQPAQTKAYAAAPGGGGASLFGAHTAPAGVSPFGQAPFGQPQGGLFGQPAAAQGGLFGQSTPAQPFSSSSLVAGRNMGPASMEVKQAVEGQANPMSKALIIVKILFKHDIITEPTKGMLKDLSLQQDHRVWGALDAYDMDQDLSELADTLLRIARITSTK